MPVATPPAIARISIERDYLVRRGDPAGVFGQYPPASVRSNQRVTTAGNVLALLGAIVMAYGLLRILAADLGYTYPLACTGARSGP